MTRCEFCGLPLAREGRVPYCSERCMTYDFFGVPALKQSEVMREIVANQRRREAPEGWTPKEAYPALRGYAAWEEAREHIIESLALING